MRAKKGNVPFRRVEATSIGNRPKFDLVSRWDEGNAQSTLWIIGCVTKKGAGRAPIPIRVSSSSRLQRFQQLSVRFRYDYRTPRTRGSRAKEEICSFSFCAEAVFIFDENGVHLATVLVVYQNSLVATSTNSDTRRLLKKQGNATTHKLSLLGQGLSRVPLGTLPSSWFKKLEACARTLGCSMHRFSLTPQQTGSLPYSRQNSPIKLP